MRVSLVNTKPSHSPGSLLDSHYRRTTHISISFILVFLLSAKDLKWTTQMRTLFPWDNKKPQISDEWIISDSGKYRGIKCKRKCEWLLWTGGSGRTPGRRTYSQLNRKGEGIHTSLSDSMGKPQSLMLLGLTHSISELLAVISVKKKIAV